MMSWWEDTGSNMFKDLDLSALRADQAYLNIKNFEDSQFSLYSLSEECYKCPFTFTTEVGNKSTKHPVDTKHNVTWRLYSRTDPTIHVNDTRLLRCEAVPENFGEFGVYEWHVVSGKCDLLTVKQPVSTRLPLILICFSLVVISCIYYISCNFICKSKKKTLSDSEHERNEMAQTTKPRIKAIDTFRGLCILFMIFVNDGGGDYWFFNHATWNGLLPADLLFPWFLWIMGVCIPIVIKSQLKKGTSRCTIIGNIFKRSVILFVLGLSLNTVVRGPAISTLRLFGVLQRISVAYLVTATISTLLTFGSYDSATKNKCRRHFNDLLMLIPQWIIFSAILASHVYLTFYFPIPGCPLGYVGPGGNQDDGLFKNCTGGVAGYIDRLLLGKSHMFKYPDIAAVYGSDRFEPEGLLGCLTSIFQVFLGVQAGAILIYHQHFEERLKRWLIWAAICIVTGLVLCQARIEGGWIPINKNLWSVSFVMITSGFAFTLLSFFYFIIDHCRYWNGAPFIYPGMNSILLFAGHMVTYRMFPWHFSIGAMNTHFMLTLESLWGTALWSVIAFWLFRKKFFLTL